jgi:hypothetical protein
MKIADTSNYFFFICLEKFDFVLIRSQFVKEPFLFKAFEENALTLLVQSKECLPLTLPP